jgi:dGTPase
VIDRIALEAREHAELSPFAALADASRGRLMPVAPDPLRTCFQRDRDRIIHAKSFRRLSHKTQVFISASGDHYRTRLTHTLEVAQISRTIARALALNEDLVEAISLGHDLGHTPFGHTGERALSQAIATHRATPYDEAAELYHHNVQSLRVVDVVENDGQGLNLSYEVRNGILCHTGAQRASTLEGRIVALADRIAYINHDIDDSIRAGFISEGALPETTRRMLGKNHSARITTLVNDVVTTSEGQPDILQSESIGAAMDELRSYLFANVYTKGDVKAEAPKAERLVITLFDYFMVHLDEVPEEYRSCSGGDPVVAVSDYVSGMTDRYARSLYEHLFVPYNWDQGLF